ncbi:four-carbon acid sugar kinase family protein [Paracoccus sp. MBLB3053]|uniref:3-oxo-tetronate kinase n=1 Tax=Paracoccus aurantius TaxID=3073814 RepID=A0ABU2HM24_9RHOB|nr:3-oxo-tetronate kinase [Paracoccus sp. MBLB3053]MDS9466083.1 four-carbon acid sugar kinase family protein [Paracoccus sp. MBLB3053]
MQNILGAIADDFTGATDLCSTWVKAGLRVIQVIGVPGPDFIPAEADAIVIALKSRTIAPDQAIAQSLAALEWLRGQGVRQVLFKYCSTFDSTPQGNIGPVTDALLDALGSDFTVVSPAFPGNGRTIYKGNLFVGDLPLAESSMKDHPLTPMRDSSLIRLMDAQSRGRTGLVPLQTLRRGPAAVTKAFEELRAQGFRYVVPDAVEDQDMMILGKALDGMALVTGGSAVAMGLPANLRESGELGAGMAPRLPRADGRPVVIAGSCSAATRAQIAHVVPLWPSLKIEIDRIAAGEDVVGQAMKWADDQSGPILIYGSSDPVEVAENQRRHGIQAAGEMMERTLSDIARGLFAQGFGKFLVAGGETSGAVISALGLGQLVIGPEVCPGVPWCGATLDGRDLALCLKSGNFGGADMFAAALEMFDV